MHFTTDSYLEYKVASKTWTDFTIIVWTHPGNVDANTSPVVSVHQASNWNTGFALYSAKGAVNKPYFWNNGGGISRSFPNPAGLIDPSKWNHLTLKYVDSISVSGYINGTAVMNAGAGSASVQNNNYLNLDTITIGRWDIDRFRGHMAQLVIYDRGLTDNEIIEDLSKSQEWSAPYC